nr:hypothetical protein [Burkholderia thailandensis]
MPLGPADVILPSAPGFLAAALKARHACDLGRDRRRIRQCRPD